MMRMIEIHGNCSIAPWPLSAEQPPRSVRSMWGKQARVSQCTRRPRPASPVTPFISSDEIDMQWEFRTGFPLVHSFNDLLFEPVDWLQYWEATSASPYACLPSLSLSRRMGDSRSRESGSARHLRSLECTCLPATNLPLHNRSFKWTLATTSEIDSIWRGELNMSCLIMISI